MDSPSTSAFAEGFLDISLLCYGTSNGCGCAETKVLVPPQETTIRVRILALMHVLLWELNIYWSKLQLSIRRCSVVIHYH
jgi:hypothetical protein